MDIVGVIALKLYTLWCYEYRYVSACKETNSANILLTVDLFVT